MTLPVWAPLTIVYGLLGGELPYERAAREQRERQAVAAWQQMTHEQREEAIQLEKIRLQREQQRQQNTEFLLRA